MIDTHTENGESAIRFLRKRDRWLRWLTETGITPFAIVVGVHLAMRMSATNQVAWPNVKTMAKALDVHERSVKRAIKELEEEGALYVARTDGKGSRYYLRSPMDP